MGVTTKLVTYEEWLSMPVVEDVIQEVVNGEIVTMPPPKARHADIVESLADILRRQLDSAQIRVRIRMFGLVIRENPLVMRIPDLAVFRKEKVVERDCYIRSAPELIVEVLSPGNTRAEEEEKLRDYESLGAPEVWVLSPEARTFEVVLLEDGEHKTRALLRGGQRRPQQFPEAVVDIAAVWPD